MTWKGLVVMIHDDRIHLFPGKLVYFRDLRIDLVSGWKDAQIEQLIKSFP